MRRINLSPVESLALNGILVVLKNEQAKVDNLRNIYFAKFIDSLEEKDIKSFDIVESDNEGYPSVIAVPPTAKELEEAMKNGPLHSESH